MDQRTERPPRKHISVILCTFNRAAKLRQCLNHLLAMEAPLELSWEVVCVDNNSTDDTKRVVEEISIGSPVPIRYFFEKIQGTSTAKNTALRHANGDILASIDDDCVASRSWLATIWKEFNSNPTLGLLGGRVELFNPEDLPLTIRTFRERRAFAPAVLFNLVPGCNMAFRRQAVNSVGNFDADFGPGGAVGVAEDADFVYRIHKAGYKIEYSPDVLVHHDHGRRTEGDRDRLEQGYVIGRGAFYAKHMLLGDRQVMRMAYWEAISLVKNIVRGAELGRSLRFLGHLTKGLLLYFSLSAWRRIVSKLKHA